MAKSVWKICALAIALVQGTAAAITITSPPKAILPRATGTSPKASACAAASSASKQFLAEQPGATQVVIAAELAYECMRSVPNYQEPAIRLLNSLRTFLEFQSNKEYLLNPPSGYLFPSLDFDGEFDTIQKKVEAGAYESEYDMQVDITALLTSARDGHLSWNGDLMNSFTFSRTTGLAAVSSDGEEIPQVYSQDDLLAADGDTGKLGPATGYAPSPVTSIDGVDVVTFLLTQSMVTRFQDPDALWNLLFPTLANKWSPLFQVPTYYPGPSTNITFANGTTFQYPNVAIVNVPLDGIQTGDDAYSSFCPGAFETQTVSDTTAASSATSTSSSQAPATTDAPPASPTIPGFPYPVIKHSAGSVAGYYLNDTGLTDVAVLQILEFQSQTDNSQEYEREFQSVVEKFLDASVQTGKRKLVIDLQGNGGGYIDLGTDTFAQLFPSIAPNSKSNLRDHLGFWILGNAASEAVTAAKKTSDVSDEQLDEYVYSPMSYQSVVSYQFYDFPDFETYYGPYPAYSGNWSAFFQNNYTDPSSSDFEGQGIIITGTNNRTGHRQPFAAQDIVVLTDGYCASTCTVFSEYLKSFANVQFIAVGGRPQTGPMQAVGGVKGSQVFEFDAMVPNWVDLFNSPNNTFLGLANGTIWENFTYEPVLREMGYSGGGVNGRNHFRIGDQTNTPLQFVYEAADCRVWWTREMLYDPTFLWSRVATIAFQERKGTQFNSKYCVTNSTGDPTSISGGWKAPWLGPQNPPENARATINGWKLQGKPLQAVSPGHSTTNSKQTGTASPASSTIGAKPTSTPGSGSGMVFGTDAVADSIDIDGTDVNGINVDSAELTSIKQACSTYTGDAWLVKAICGALNGSK
ncbi:uncharacterized protein PV07_11257 [Cladophialophora immunda]|uniref:Uncharacterized protein n=1 Tax=Cladophialophora immunda TaxID=569365 RepID=A0A0D2BXJ9_9EURO|nr:uncharacterized protein PV07_11257 [Cladophialophora immunda]KIW23025.1 hypothetical protein PV07_11257 [Cladophialophora immunda]OQU93685.1 hypothetical protein CLAIMM_00165 [Cladophialophora immunda]